MDNKAYEKVDVSSGRGKEFNQISIKIAALLAYLNLDEKLNDELLILIKKLVLTCEKDAFCHGFDFAQKNEKGDTNEKF